MTAEPDRPSDRSPSLLTRLVDVRPNEVDAVLWSFACFLCVLTSYYVIRPLRDEMGAAAGPDGLKRLFFAVFVVMLVAVPAFGAVIARLAKGRIVPVFYGFFGLNLLAFWALFASGGRGLHWLTVTLPFLGRISVTTADAFFVWVSVFNLFVVSLFWSLMADLFSNAEAKRLFGFIAAGGSVGALAGPLLTQSLVRHIGPVNLLPMSLLFLIGALGCVIGLKRSVRSHPELGTDKPEADEVPIGRGIWSGATHVFNSRYLGYIALWVLLANLLSTLLYSELLGIVARAYPDASVRVQLFARMDLTVSVLSILGQILVTGRVLERIGVGTAAAALPAVAMLAFIGLVAAPGLGIVVLAMVLGRAVNFAFSNPAMKVLFTVVKTDEKYKSLNFIDTVVYRGGDAAAGWLFATLTNGGYAIGAISLMMLPLAAIWTWLSFVVGAMQAERAKTMAAGSNRGPA